MALCWGVGCRESTEGVGGKRNYIIIHNPHISQTSPLPAFPTPLTFFIIATMQPLHIQSFEVIHE
ncbi:hypothetical protein [Nostoc sphaeroides]|uniref:hypothetical protein n=1 Tax=Nostoc sphaeroides TaxID=446679 RepID=UPI001269DA3D|nr:hypothetical protein [Nostoc sphaeroides]